MWRFDLGEYKLWCTVIKVKYGICLEGPENQGHHPGSRVRPLERYHEGVGGFSPLGFLSIGERQQNFFLVGCLVLPNISTGQVPGVICLGFPSGGVSADCWTHSPAGGVWAPIFRRGAQDWELEAFESSFRMLQDVHPISQEVDKWRWKSQGNGSFTVSSFYHSLTGIGDPCFPWKGIWVNRVPSNVCFFGWAATKGATLTIDNLRRRKLFVTEWCYMCKRNAETTDHLLIHCDSACELLSLVFSIFGVQ